MPTTSSESGRVVLLRAFRILSFFSAISMIALIMASKPFSSCRIRTLSFEISSGYCSQKRSTVNFTSQADEHELSAEIRMHGNVPENTLRNNGFRCVDGNAAAVRVIHGHNIIDIRILREKLAADAFQRCIQDTGDALHRRIDSEDVSGAGRAAF